MSGMTLHAATAPAFRGDVEGLRAFCVLAVVLYHVSPEALPGGFLGVDMFFVISGFVITRLLIADHCAHGRIRLLAFWERRIRRILPVAVLVLATTALAILAFPILDARTLARDLMAAALFYHNIRQMSRAVDYLGAPPETNPTLHYWSLAVEEQFYLLWPLVLTAVLWLAARSLGKRWMAGVASSMALMAAGFFLVCVWLAAHDPAVAFFHPAARAWQLIAGACIACLEPGLRGMPRARANVMALAAATAIAWVLTSAPFGHNYPGVWSAVPTLSTAALIAACGGTSPTAVGKALALPVLRFFGRISFSLYLWHWPVLVFARVGWGDSLAVGLGAVGVSVALAALSHYGVEQPVRTWHGRRLPDARDIERPTDGARRRWDRSLVPGYALGAALIAVGAAVSGAMRVTAPDQLSVGNGVLVSAATARRDRPAIYDGCLARMADTALPSCAFGDVAAKRTVVLMGDSHAANWFEPLRDAAHAEGWRLLVRVKASCRPLLMAQTRAHAGREIPYPECGSFLAATLDELRNDPSLRLIVVGGSRHPFGRDIEAATFKKLAGIAPVVVMHDTPWLPVSAIDCLRQNSADLCVWPLDRLLAGTTFPQPDHGSLPDRVRIVDLNAQVCPGGRCTAAVDGWPMMFDSHHFTATFSRRFATDFVRQLRAAVAPE